MSASKKPRFSAREVAAIRRLNASPPEPNAALLDAARLHAARSHATEAEKRGRGRPKLGNTKALSLELSPSLLEIVDEAAAEAGLARVEWLRRAAAYCATTKIPLRYVTVG